MRVAQYESSDLILKFCLSSTDIIYVGRYVVETIQQIMYVHTWKINKSFLSDMANKTNVIFYMSKKIREIFKESLGNLQCMQWWEFDNEMKIWREPVPKDSFRTKLQNVVGLYKYVEQISSGLKIA